MYVCIFTYMYIIMFVAYNIVCTTNLVEFLLFFLRHRFTLTLTLTLVLFQQPQRVAYLSEISVSLCRCVYMFNVCVKERHVS